MTFEIKISSANFVADSIQKYQTKESAEAALATLPKSLKAFVRSIGTWDENNEYYTYYEISLYADFVARSNNAKNETGIKRLRKFVETQTFEYKKSCTGEFETFEEAFAAVTA